MPDTSQILDANSLKRALARIAHEIAERNEDSREVALIGVPRGGDHLARRLADTLQTIWGHAVPVGTLDVSMHRDDLATAATPTVHPTVVPFDLTGKVVILVDDVLYSGRTTRAALDALHDLGRPKCVQLAVLIDRGHRELPIRPDFVGKNVPTSRSERVDVSLKEDGGNDAVTLIKP